MTGVGALSAVGTVLRQCHVGTLRLLNRFVRRRSWVFVAHTCRKFRPTIRTFFGRFFAVFVVLVPRFPGHFVLLFQTTTSIGKPCAHLKMGEICSNIIKKVELFPKQHTNLRKSHFGDDGQHDFLSFRRVRVFAMFV